MPQRFIFYTISFFLFITVNYQQAYSQASFNCNLARSSNELEICRDSNLSRLDIELNNVYKKIRNTSLSNRVRTSQRRWIRQRSRCNGNNRCLMSMYVRRVHELKLALSFLPAFDCRKARSPDELTICRVRGLSKLDRQLNELYTRARNEAYGSNILQEQRRWLRERRDCRNNSYCLRNTYTQRIAELRRAVSSENNNPSFDCSRARQNAEIAVCADPQLAALDRELTDQYNKISTPNIIASQRSWLSERRACSFDIDCLRSSYNQRITFLRNIQNNQFNVARNDLDEPKDSVESDTHESENEEEVQTEKIQAEEKRKFEQASADIDDVGTQSEKQSSTSKVQASTTEKDPLRRIAGNTAKLHSIGKEPVYVSQNMFVWESCGSSDATYWVMLRNVDPKLQIKDLPFIRSLHRYVSKSPSYTMFSESIAVEGEFTPLVFNRCPNIRSAYVYVYVQGYMFIYTKGTRYSKGAKEHKAFTIAKEIYEADNLDISKYKNELIKAEHLVLLPAVLRITRLNDSIKNNVMRRPTEYYNEFILTRYNSQIVDSSVNDILQQASSVEALDFGSELTARKLTSSLGENEETRNKKWQETLSAITNLDKQDSEKLKKMVALLKQMQGKKELVSYSDTFFASWIKSMIEAKSATLDDAFLEDIGKLELFLGELKALDIPDSFPKIQAALSSSIEKTASITALRVATLEKDALEIINSSGTSYADVDKAFEAGVALASEFSNSGFNENSVRLISATAVRVAKILKEGLPTYKEELATLEATTYNLENLEQKAEFFKILSNQFEEYEAYEQAALKRIEKIRDGACENHIKSVSDKSAPVSASIAVGSQNYPLKDFSCSLYKNRHVIKSFVWDDKIDGYRLEISESSGQRTTLKIEKNWSLFSGNLLKVVAFVDEQVVSIKPEQWKQTANYLLKPAPSGKPNAKGVTECDQLAADPDDTQKLTEGVDFEKGDLNIRNIARGVEACIASVEENPEDARQLYQLGRVLWYSGDQEQAQGFLERSSQKGYVPALYLRAMALLSQAENNHNKFVDAYNVFEKAQKSGYVKAAAMVKELNPDGVEYYKEIPAPTGADVLSTLPAGEQCESFLTAKLCVKFTSATVRNCFQTSATDFTCEWTAKARCITGGGRGMNLLFQNICSNGDDIFSTFRKHANGKWERFD